METLKTKETAVPITHLKGYTANNFFGLTVSTDIGQIFKKGTDLLIRKNKQANQGDYVILKGEDEEPFLMRQVFFDSKDSENYLLSDPQMCNPDEFIDKSHFEYLLLGTVFLSITHYEDNPGGAE